MALVALSPSSAQAAIQDSAAIQAAINAASPGQTITIPAGTFTGSLKISGKSDLTIQGQGTSTILQAPGQAEVLGVYSSSNITLRDFAVQGDYAVTSQRGVSLSGVAGLTARNLTIRDVGFTGFYSNGPLTDAFLSRVNVTHSGDFGIHIQAASTGLINRVVIEDSITSGFASRLYAGHGIYIKRANDVTIRRSEASGVAKLMGNGSGGMQFSYSTNVRVEDSRAYNNAESGFIVEAGEAAFYRSSGWNNPGGDFYECNSDGYTITYVDSYSTVRVWPTPSGTIWSTMVASTTTTTGATTTTTGVQTTATAPPTTTTAPPTTTTAPPSGGSIPVKASSSGGFFPDVALNSLYGKAVVTLAEAGVVSGFEDGNFSADRPVTRAQLAKMVAGTLGIADGESTWTPFLDLGPVRSDLYPHKYVAALFSLGVIEGTSPDRFSPNDYASRAQLVSIAAMALRTVTPGALLEPPASFVSAVGLFDPSHEESMRYAEYNGLLAGLHAYGTAWDPWAIATRGEAAQVLYNLGILE